MAYIVGSIIGDVLGYGENNKIDFDGNIWEDITEICLWLLDYVRWNQPKCDKYISVGWFLIPDVILFTHKR